MPRIPRRLSPRAISDNRAHARRHKHLRIPVMAVDAQHVGCAIAKYAADLLHDLLGRLMLMMKMACSRDHTGILLLRSMSIPGRVREIISLDFKAGHEIATREQLFGLPEHPATSATSSA